MSVTLGFQEFQLFSFQLTLGSYENPRKLGLGEESFLLFCSQRAEDLGFC